MRYTICQRATNRFRLSELTKHYPRCPLDFLEDWSSFVQKLSNIFGSYTLEDDDEDTIMAISFPNEGKTMNYFICFAKYQNCICWDDCSLWKVVKDALPACIWDELCISHEDLSSFEGLRRSILRIDNDYWKHQLEDKHKFWGTHTSSNALTRPPREESIKFVLITEVLASLDRNLRDRFRPLFPAPHNDLLAPLLSGVLGLDGHLTPTERQW